MTYFQVSSECMSRYDVLILHADEDLQFAERMVQVLDQQNIKVCLKDRDLLGWLWLLQFTWYFSIFIDNII